MPEVMMTRPLLLSLELCPEFDTDEKLKPFISDSGETMRAFSELTDVGEIKGPTVEQRMFCLIETLYLQPGAVMKFRVAVCERVMKNYTRLRGEDTEATDSVAPQELIDAMKVEGTDNLAVKAKRDSVRAERRRLAYERHMSKEWAVGRTVISHALRAMTCKDPLKCYRAALKSFTEMNGSQAEIDRHNLWAMNTALKAHEGTL